MSRAEAGEPMSAPRSPVNALHWIGGGAAFVYTAWCWGEFSGPFRGLIDLQVALTGRFYWEPLAVAVLLGGLLAVVVFVAGLLDPIVPRFRAKTWGWLALLVALLATAGGLAQAWRLWTAPPGPTRPVPPLRVLDLDRPLPPDAPFGPVRIVGRADLDDRVKLRREPRGYRIFQPLSGRHRPARDLPVPVIASCYDRYGRDCLTGPLEGWLSPGGYDDRDSYRLRRAGVLTTPHYYALTPGLPTADTYVEASDQDTSGAVDIVLCLGFFWAVVIITWILAPPSSFPAKPAASPAPAQAPDLVVAADDRPNPYLLPLFVAGFAFVGLSALGVFIWAINAVYELIW